MTSSSELWRSPWAWALLTAETVAIVWALPSVAEQAVRLLLWPGPAGGGAAGRFR